MWQVYCVDCGQRTLLGPRRIVEMINVSPGVILVVLECFAGHRIEMPTGRVTREQSWAHCC